MSDSRLGVDGLRARREAAAAAATSGGGDSVEAAFPAQLEQRTAEERPYFPSGWTPPKAEGVPRERLLATMDAVLAGARRR